MKKTIWIAALLALVFIAAASKPIRLVRLTIVNKAEQDLEIKLTGLEDENFYYLRVAGGSRSVPTEKTFTIVPDTYEIKPYYVEIWDPVYGFDCGDSSAKRLEIYHNTRVVIGECNWSLPNAGEPTMVKFGGITCRAGPRRR